MINGIFLTVVYTVFHMGVLSLISVLLVNVNNVHAFEIHQTKRQFNIINKMIALLLLYLIKNILEISVLTDNITLKHTL